MEAHTWKTDGSFEIKINPNEIFWIKIPAFQLVKKMAFLGALGMVAMTIALIYRDLGIWYVPIIGFIGLIIIPFIVPGPIGLRLDGMQIYSKFFKNPPKPIKSYVVYNKVLVELYPSAKMSCANPIEFSFSDVIGYKLSEGNKETGPLIIFQLADDVYYSYVGFKEDFLIAMEKLYLNWVAKNDHFSYTPVEFVKG